ncbi:MAG: amidohydrolase family protein [Bacteroidota bacterium]
MSANASIHWKLAVVASILVILLGCERNPSQPSQQVLTDLLAQVSPDLVIRNGTLIDGTGGPTRVTDIILSGDSILYIGEVPDLAEIPSLELSGEVVAPGFIDAHAHGDPLRNPDFQNFLSMGVTSICLGQDGFSPPYHDIKAWMSKVDGVALGLNIIPFVGHNTLRELSGIRFEENPSEEALAQMDTLLQNALEAGCFGVSTGLEYTPGMYAGKKELGQVAETAGAYGRIMMSHIRNEDDDQLRASLEELIALGAYCPVHVSHLKSVYGKSVERAEIILSWLAEGREAGKQVTADMYPYTASYTTIGIVFPKWARPPNNYQQVRQRRGGELRQYLKNRILQRNGPSATLFGTRPYAGKTLQELSEEKNRPYEDVLMEEITPTGASAAYFIMDEELQTRLIQDSMVMVSSDGSPTMRHPRGYGTFAKMIAYYYLEKKIVDLPELIRKMTALPAQLLSMTDRGTLTVGKKADIVIFNPEKVRENASFENPHVYASGFDYVFINGHMVMKADSLVYQGGGKLLRAARP